MASIHLFELLVLLLMVNSYVQEGESLYVGKCSPHNYYLAWPSISNVLIGISQSHTEIDPQNLTVPIGGNATFFCSGNGSNVLWIIDNTTEVCENQRSKFMSFTFTCDLRDGVHSLTLTVPAYPENNNTQIRCKTYYGYNVEISSTVYLTVIGMYRY